MQPIGSVRGGCYFGYVVAIGMRCGGCHISGFSAFFSARLDRASSVDTRQYKKLAAFLYCTGLIFN